MHVERRNHHHRDHGNVQKHDDRLTPGVLSKTPYPSEASTDKQPDAHSDFEEENQIRS
jgi:hypothetical protein